MSEKRITVFECGPHRDHECNCDGPPVVILANGTTMPESEWREKNPGTFRGLTGGSATCSKCGLDSMTLSMWRDF